MSQPAFQQSERGERTALLAIFTLSLLVRAVYFFQIRDNPFVQSPILDMQAYYQWAQRIAQGDWLGDQVFYQDPLYPYLLAILLRIFGDHIPLIIALQLLLGSLLPLLVYLIGTRIFNRPSALLAALITAIYKPLLVYEGLLLKTFLEALFLTLALLLLLLAVERSSVRYGFVAGLTLGLGALARANFLLLPVPILVWIMIATPKFRRPLAAAFTVGVVLIITPVTLRNYLVAQDLILTTAQAGQNFYTGNNPANRSGVYVRPPFVRPDPKFERIDFHHRAEVLAGRPLKPSEVSRFWFHEAWNYIRQEPGTFLALLGKKALLFWNAVEPPDNINFYFLQRFSPLLELPLPAFGFIGPLALLGILLALPIWRSSLPLYLTSLTYAASVIPFYILSRYRIAIIPLLTLFAGHALYTLWERFRSRQYRQFLLGIGLGIPLAWLVYLPIGPRMDFSASHLNLGILYARRGDFDRAIREYHQALNIPEASMNLSIAYLATGRLDEALAAAKEGVRRRGEWGDAHKILGDVYTAKGRLHEARAAYLEALRLEPSSAQIHLDLGRLYLRHHQIPPAIQEFLTTLEIDPKRVEAYYHLGEAYAIQGEVSLALAAYTRFIEKWQGAPTYREWASAEIQKLKPK
jgi:4-amino-4-deoxy-L-arabinose transferase-like glycosyltransferase/Tfp pilus assembly protein PilF